MNGLSTFTILLMIEKNRDGATGTAFAKFFGKYKLFADWDGPPPDVDGAS